STSVNDWPVIWDMFVGLLTPDAAGQPIAGAAQSWTVSGDERVYTFKLRPGATWSDGTPVTADDFVYAWRRLQDPATGARFASLFHAVKNAAEINSGKMAPEELGVKALDDATFEVTLNNPVPYFFELLIHPAALPLHRESVEKFGDN